MTQLEYVVSQFIKEHPRCTQADIMASFAKPPDEGILDNVLEALQFQHQIKVLPIQPQSAQEPLMTYYYPSESLLKAELWLKA